MSLSKQYSYGGSYESDLSIEGGLSESMICLDNVFAFVIIEVWYREDKNNNTLRTKVW